MISIFILHPKSNFLELTSYTVNLAESYYPPNHKNYNFLNCDWFKKLLFSTNSLAKLLSDSSTNQSNSKL